MNAPPFRAAVLLALALLGSACAHLGPAERREAGGLARAAQSTAVDCTDCADCRQQAICAVASPLLALGAAADAASAPGAPHHEVILLDAGQDALLARVHLIRAARSTIDLQTFHFDSDDAGRVVLDALRDAARRGVRVRLMLDPLSGLPDPALQARLAAFHRNFEVRLYNPLFRKSRVNPLEFGGGILFRFRELNSRMHNKLMVVDGRVAVIGGRNVQDQYFDWSPDYNYRDRDLLVAGPVVAEMTANFDGFWNDPRSVPAAQLADVARELLRNHGAPPDGEGPRSARVEAMAQAAGDGAAVFARLAPYRYPVGRVEFFGDLPVKHALGAKAHAAASDALLHTLAASQSEILLQTPYLVMSRPARRLFRELYHRTGRKVTVSTNSLAATDAFPVYAMSHKYKRLYLRELGFRIYEYRPFPADMPVGLAALSGVANPALGRPDFSPSGFRQGPVPLKRAGVRVGLHSKSMVVDEAIGIVGSHNFDPRSNDYNTESLVMVHDEAFARALAGSIRRDIAPGNSWVIAPRPELPVVAQLNYNLGKLSEKLPVFDVWPWPYATSYELRAGCTPVPPEDAGFAACYRDVGDFPEVNLTLKMVYTRVITVFGAGLIPIL
jgi:phosphatidylserine/phosphatidylglycerophosphate/cardiolipin synthase-like enzyme